MKNINNIIFEESAAHYDENAYGEEFYGEGSYGDHDVTHRFNRRAFDQMQSHTEMTHMENNDAHVQEHMDEAAKEMYAKDMYPHHYCAAPSDAPHSDASYASSAKHQQCGKGPSRNTAFLNASCRSASVVTTAASAASSSSIPQTSSCSSIKNKDKDKDKGENHINQDAHNCESARQTSHGFSHANACISPSERPQPSVAAANTLEHPHAITFLCDHLVRSEEIEHLHSSGIQGHAVTMCQGEEARYLLQKLATEAKEAFEAFQGGDKDHMWKELSDTWEAMDAFLTLEQRGWEDLKGLSSKTKSRRGSYAKGLILKSITLSSQHPRLAHYQNSFGYHQQNG